MDPEKDMQEKVLLFLMHHPSMTFNELWNKEGRSNKFAYHLKQLEQKGLVEKTQGGKYALSLAGKKEVAFIDEPSGKRGSFPVVAVVVLIEKDDCYLMLHRAKEPFLGYWGIHGGKLRADNYILDQARESIKKETGLSCELAFKGLFSSKSYVDGDFAYHHQLFVVHATNPQGELIEETPKGANTWVKKDEITQLQILPNIPDLIRIATGRQFRWIEADRLENEGLFSMNILRDLEL